MDAAYSLLLCTEVLWVSLNCAALEPVALVCSKQCHWSLHWRCGAPSACFCNFANTFFQSHTPFAIKAGSLYAPLELHWNNLHGKQKIASASLLYSMKECLIVIGRKWPVLLTEQCFWVFGQVGLWWSSFLCAQIHRCAAFIGNTLKDPYTRPDAARLTGCICWYLWRRAFF